MIRITALTFIVAVLSAYAYRDWYKSLCGLIVLMAVLQHPDMPKSILNIPGFNLWNVLFLNILISWFINRRKEGLVWDMPKVVSRLIVIYLIIILVGFARMILDTRGITLYAAMQGSLPYSTAYYYQDYLLNTIKWAIPGILLFDGCRTQKQFVMALLSILLFYFIIALLIVKSMPLGMIGDSGEQMSYRANKVLSRNVGYHRVNLSMMMAGAFWAMFSLRELTNKITLKYGLLIACLIILLAQALTGGRMGYVAWGCISLILCSLRWRKYLILAPLFVVIGLIFVPSVKDRMLQGFESENTPYKTEREVNINEVTSDRILAWPFVIDKIKESPWFGYGREAMQNSGVSAAMASKYGRQEAFPHPHQAYLQWILDNGLVGFIPIVIFYFLMVKYSLALFLDSTRPVYITIGGVSSSIILALLIASFGSQTFYPRQEALAIWCAMGLMLRVYVQRSNLLKLNVKEGLNDSINNLWVNPQKNISN